MVPVTCKLCSSLGAESEFWTSDDRKKHTQFHARQSYYILDDGEQPSVKEIFGKCFPSEDFEKSEDIEKSRSMLMKICHHIIKSNMNESNSIQCQICASKVRYIKKGQETHLILTHACTHSTKKPFVCRDCQHESSTRSNVVYHIKNAHKIASPVQGVHFDENWSDCFDEVKESLAKNFVRLNLDPGWSTKIQTPPSELSIQRRSIFKNISKRAKVAKKIRCNQCQVDIRTTGGTNLEDHIRFHLQQRIYDCAMCKSTFIHTSNITKHLAKKHGYRSKGSYIDHSDEHHEAILDWVKKCFGKEESD